MANHLPHNPDGTLASLPEASLERMKTRVQEELALGKTLKAALESAQVAPVTFWRMRRQDPELAEMVDDWLKSAGFEAGLTMQDAIRNPAAHESGLKYASWANFNMILAKGTFPELRDNFQINVNVDARTAIGDWQAAVQAIDQAEQTKASGA